MGRPFRSFCSSQAIFPFGISLRQSVLSMSCVWKYSPWSKRNIKGWDKTGFRQRDQQTWCRASRSGTRCSRCAVPHGWRALQHWGETKRFCTKNKNWETLFCCRWKAFQNHNLKLCCLLSSQCCPRGAARRCLTHPHTGNPEPSLLSAEQGTSPGSGHGSPTPLVHLPSCPWALEGLEVRRWRHRGDESGLGHRTAPQPGSAQLLLAGSRQAAAPRPRRWAPVVFFSLLLGSELSLLLHIPSTCYSGDTKQICSAKVGSALGFNESSQGYLALTNQ